MFVALDVKKQFRLIIIAIIIFFSLGAKSHGSYFKFGSYYNFYILHLETYYRSLYEGYMQ